MSFAENIKIIRNERNISQEQLAELLDVSRQAVSKWEQGNGYPETEKLLRISKELNVSLDYLMFNRQDLESNINDTDMKTNVIVPTGKIAIITHDGKNLVTCYKVSVSEMFMNGKNEPKYILNGVDKVTFLGEHTNTLGWYTTEEDIKREIAAISETINKGILTYELKYAAKVKVGFIGVKLEK